MGEGGGFRKCTGVGRWVQKKTKCRSKVTGKGRSKRKNKKKSRSGEI